MCFDKVVVCFLNLSIPVLKLHIYNCKIGGTQGIVSALIE